MPIGWLPSPKGPLPPEDYGARHHVDPLNSSKAEEVMFDTPSKSSAEILSDIDFFLSNEMMCNVSIEIVGPGYHEGIQGISLTRV